MNISRNFMRKAIRVSLVVGTALALINHGTMLAVGDITPTRIIQIVLCYMVPFGVSLYSQITAIQQELFVSGMPSKEDSIGR